MFWLKLAIGCALAWTGANFISFWRRLLKLRRLGPEAWPRGSPREGVIYALGKGLLPWEKESTRRHWLIYLIGISYHLSIAAGFLWLGIIIFSPLASSSPRLFLTPFLAIGAGAGLSLFWRRVLNPKLRNLSQPDDYAANLLVDSFLFSAALTTVKPGTEAFLLVMSFCLILYIPLGKIRHCVFFLPSRFIFGRYFGRRGILPQQSGVKESV
jgi:hypothetical protein